MEKGNYTLVVVCGPPGVGKTTVAERIADKVGAKHLRTDLIRKEMVPDPEYDERETEAVYKAMCERAKKIIMQGRSVILDGTFRWEKHRKNMREISECENSEWRLIRVECDENKVRERIADRKGDESDADFDTHVQIKSDFEPISQGHIVIDNSGDKQETFRKIPL